MNRNEAMPALQNDAFGECFHRLYGSAGETMDYQKKRYREALERFALHFPGREDVRIYSAPGRTEIGGNHTDHQHGCVLAAAVNLDMIAVVAFHEEQVIRVKSEGYDAFTVSLNKLQVQKNEGGSAAIVRGIASKFVEIGVNIGGFDMYSTSDVLGGSGISSSAAFETLVGTIIDSYYNHGQAGSVEIAKIGQYAENVYFGKKSGLLDQMVCSVGGLVAIDFEDTDNPVIDPFQYDFEENGYCLCITNTGGSHAGLTEEYVAVRSEMERIAAEFGKEYLRQVSEAEFYRKLPELRKKCSDRAVMRAMHFFHENRRAQEEARMLRDGNIEGFLSLVQQSGDSSESLLQNLYACGNPTEQAIPLGIAVSKHFLGGRGAVRVHGGGFAGTIQAFVPAEMTEDYIEEMNRIYGEHACEKLRIRPAGGVEVRIERRR